MAMDKGDTRQPALSSRRLAQWTAPAVQRLEAGAAENSCCTHSDNIINFS
jgi:hypothetical protein